MPIFLVNYWMFVPRLLKWPWCLRILAIKLCLLSSHLERSGLHSEKKDLVLICTKSLCNFIGRGWSYFFTLLCKGTHREYFWIMYNCMENWQITKDNSGGSRGTPTPKDGNANFAKKTAFKMKKLNTEDRIHHWTANNRYFHPTPYSKDFEWVSYVCPPSRPDSNDRGFQHLGLRLLRDENSTLRLGFRYRSLHQHTVEQREEILQSRCLQTKQTY